MTTAIHPEGILRDLNDQWEKMGHEQAIQGGVLRACAMTLIVVAGDDADADLARQTLALLMRDHPSRGIVIRGRKHGEFDARVFAECWKPFGKTQQICSEGIEIFPGPGDLEEVARFLVPLHVPDLPVVVWVRGSGPSDALGTHPLYPLSDKILFDTGSDSDADASLRALRRLHAYGYRVADLHWTRLTPWREVIAHLFDCGMAANDIRSVHVGYGSGPISTCARYMEAWLSVALPLARVSIAPDYGSPGLQSVTLSGRAGQSSVTLADAHSLKIATPGHHYQTAFPARSEEAVMREELGIVGPDAIYEQVLNA